MKDSALLTGIQTDRMYTPLPWAKACVDALPLSGRVLDPAKGEGAFLDQFPADVDALWCECDQGRNFFDFDEKVDWIVTNPPWSIIRPFLTHAFELADNVAFMITVQHAFTKARIRLAEEAGFGVRAVYYMPTPPKPWPASGNQVALVWWERNRLSQLTEHSWIEVKA